jgi:hypothetical protein
VITAEEVVMGSRAEPVLGPDAVAVELRLPLPGSVPPLRFEVGPAGASVWLRLGPDGPGLDSDVDLAEGAVELERFEDRPGGVVQGRGEVRFQTATGQPTAARIRFLTFVRDVASSS